MFKCEIKTGGSAFRDDGDLDPFGTEVRRILRHIINDLGDGKPDGVIMDSNGNKVGTWSYS